MITLATIEDTGSVKISKQEISDYAFNRKITQAEAYKKLLQKNKGPIYGHDYISDVYEIKVIERESEIFVRWRLKCAS